jgi:L-alanine-DL-glutamate epimerase-like enolase superfamily enzyme
MRLSDIRSYALSSPIDPPQERPFHGGYRRLLKRDVVLLVVEAADGELGFSTAGASSSSMKEYFEGESQGTFADVVADEVAPVVEGETLADPAEIHDLLAKTDLPEHLRREAASALDVALYDLYGKEVGAPIYELLAERTDETPTETLPLYASAGMYMEPDGYARQAEIVDDLGFFGYKYRPGIGPEGDRRTVELLADRVDTEIMVDAHTWWKLRDAYDRDTVRSLVEHAGDHGVYWVEEPVEPDDYDGYVDLAGTGVPLAGGESEESAEGLIALADTGAVRFLQGDVRHHSGYTGCWEAVERCAGSDVQFVPHNFGTWLGLVANAHLVAAAPECDLLEYPVFEDDPALDGDGDPGMYPYDLAFDILADDLTVDDGALAVPEGPGLGVEVDLDVIEEYPFVEGPWTEFHYDDE